MKSTQRAPQVMAAIPAFNEEASIAAIVLATKHHVDLVLVIDDGSTDHTARIAEGAGATVIRHVRNQGKAAGMMSAFAFASVIAADVVVLLDGDGQHNPDEIPSLVAPVLAGTADVVVGSRFLGVKNPIPFYRTIGQRVLNHATHFGSGLRCSDSQSGFRALNRRAYEALDLKEVFLHGLGVESEMQFALAKARLTLAEVPVYVRYDERARRSPLKHGFSVLYRVMVFSLRRWTAVTSWQDTRRRLKWGIKA